MHPYRTHTCGELRAEHDGNEVRLSGWVYRKRDHGGLLFIDLRDHTGVTQIVIQPEQPFFAACQDVRVESVITVNGKVERRTEETINPRMPTGEIEVLAASVHIESAAEVLPILVTPGDEGPEELRLRYRYLDLRREHMHRHILFRSAVIADIRRRMVEHGFHEIQTPILTCSSPEGARDYLVPSRVHHGQFYALPQAPQQFKQLLMVAGFDKYFQIAPCFRDEDARADRSPGEFYQLDMEMAFATQDDVFAVIEDVLTGVFKTHSDWAAPTPFPRIPYREAMVKYGTDKPDLRIPIEMLDVSDVFEGCGFNAFSKAVARGAVVRAIPVSGIADRPRSFFDKLVEFALAAGGKGLAYLVWTPDTVKGPIAKFLTEEERSELASRCGAGAGDVVFFVCDEPGVASRVSGEVRGKLGRDLELIPDGVYRFCWVVDFPMYERDEETGSVAFSHNPFSMPQGGMEALERQDPLDILAFQYDIVCNGVELSSGAIRNHSPEIMYKAFEIAGYSKDDVETRFPALLNAFRYGAPPHGGIAPGIDRIVMLLARVSNIREVIAFPMNQRAQDLMMGAPAEVSEQQLRELHIKVREHNVLHVKPR